MERQEKEKKVQPVPTPLFIFTKQLQKKLLLLPTETKFEVFFGTYNISNDFLCIVCNSIISLHLLDKESILKLQHNDAVCKTVDTSESLWVY